MPRRLIANVENDRECTEECQSYQHANELISVITLPPKGIVDRQIASYFRSKCSNFAKLRDTCGRTLLHIAASCGRRDLAVWLLKIYADNIDVAEIESGYTALHRSIAHGFINIAVALIKMNAKLNVKDNEDLCPLDMLLSDINLLSVDSIIHIRFPPGDDTYKNRSYNSNDSEVLCTGEANAKRQSDYDLFSRFCKEKLDTLKQVSYASATEVYTWGENSNYTSGFGSARGKLRPELLEFFEKKNEIIVEISMQRFHTLFVSLSGSVWSCGIGQGGRLGSSTGIVLIPESVPLKLPFGPNMFCISVAAGQDHSVFLCNDNKVFVCGTNTYHQLGISPPSASVTKPVPVDIVLERERILGVAASDYHSVVWTRSRIFSCGLHAGQLGHPFWEDKTVSTFQKALITVTPILAVTVSKAATVIGTSSHIYVLMNYKIIRIELKSILRSIDYKQQERNYRNQYRLDRRVESQMKLVRHDRFRRILKLVAIGGEMDAEKIKSFSISPSTEELQIAVVLHDGSLYLWKNRSEQLLRCHFRNRQDISVTDVIMNFKGLWISTTKGEVLRIRSFDRINFSLDLDDGFTYISHHTERSVSGCTNECYILGTKKVESVFRAVSIFSDPKGDNFAILQHRSTDSLASTPSTVGSTMKSDLTQFYRETDDTDSFHDIIFKIQQKSFAAHKYILASCSEQFLKFEEHDGMVVIDDVRPVVFETMLEFAYTGFCRVRKNSCPNLQYDVLLKRLQEAAEKFKINKLIIFLGAVSEDDFAVNPDSDFVINREVIPSLSFNRLKFSSLYDVKLKSDDGAVLYAHKCILVARVEYFKLMWSGHWKESCQSNQSYAIPYTGAVLNGMLEYLYTDNVSRNAEKKDWQLWCSLLVAADQFFLMKLKELSERELSRHFTVRNVVDLLLFADAVNADGLKTTCFEFICINLPTILFFRCLEKVNNELLDELTRYYREEFRNADFRKFRDVPVYSTVCDIDEIFAAEALYPVDWDAISDTNHDCEKPAGSVEKAKPRPRTKNQRKSVRPEVDENSNKAHSCQQIRTSAVEGSSVTGEKVSEGEWVAVDRQQMKLVKSRLRVNAAVRESPQLLEQKENYQPLNGTNSCSSAEPVTESEPHNIPHERSTLGDSNYSIEINFSKVTPKMSQAERKRLRRVSESAKNSVLSSSPENTNNNNPSPSSSPSGCWRALQPTSETATPFKSIVASEKKQKTSVIKETKKFEEKSLDSAQKEEQAIQELEIFYNVKGVDDEHITVQRVIHKISAPQWVVK